MQPTPDKDKDGDSSWFAWIGALFGGDSKNTPPPDTGTPGDTAADSGSVDAGGADGGGGGGE